MNKQSILIVDPVGVKAGMNYYDTQLATALNYYGIKTIVASNYSDTDIEIKVFQSEKLTSNINKLLDILNGLFRILFFGKKNKFNFFIFHIFSTEPKELLLIKFSKFCGFKIIIIAHDINGFAGTDNKFIKNIIFNKLSDIIIVHNKYSFNLIKNFLCPSSSQNLFTIPHGGYIELFNNSDYSKLTARSKLGIDDHKFVILFFGQIKKVKGLDLLLNSIPLVNKDILLIIAGKPWKDDFSQYNDIIYNLNIEKKINLYIRYISDYERDIFFKASDLLVLPYREVYQSGVLLMAMSYKLLVLASDIEANSEIISDGENGFLFKNGSSINLASKINFILNLDSDEIKLLVNRAFEYIKSNHSWKKVAEMYNSIIYENSNNRF